MCSQVHSHLDLWPPNSTQFILESNWRFDPRTATRTNEVDVGWGTETDTFIEHRLQSLHRKSGISFIWTSHVPKTQPGGTRLGNCVWKCVFVVCVCVCVCVTPLKATHPVGPVHDVFTWVHTHRCGTARGTLQFISNSSLRSQIKDLKERLVVYHFVFLKGLTTCSSGSV